VFPVSFSVAIVGFVEIVIIGLTIGSLSGLLVSLILKERAQGIVKDSFLGLTGSMIALIWFDQGIAMGKFHHPFTMAVIIAVIPPALHQLLRFRHLR